MARTMVKQRYFAAVQDLRDGRTTLTLLEEAKDTASCHNLMKSPEFVAKYAQMNLPTRVCIIRDEPAYIAQAKPNELACKIREASGEQADHILNLLTQHGVKVTGDVQISEVGLGVELGSGVVEAPEEACVPQEEGIETAKAPEVQAPTQSMPTAAPTYVPPAPPIPPAAPQPTKVQPPQTAKAVLPPPPPPQVATPAKKDPEFLDTLRLVPKNYQVLPHPTLLMIAKEIDSNIDPRTCTKLACIAVISRYLDTGQRNIKQEIPAALEPEPEPDVDRTEVPPVQDGPWTLVTCPHCQCMVWQNNTAKMVDPVDDERGSYPEHNCPGYLKRRGVPQGPPPIMERSVPMPPMGMPPAGGGFTKGGTLSGQAEDIGVPPFPPPPPPPPE